MPGIILFLAKVLFIVAWIIQFLLILYSIGKIISQTSDSWVENSKVLFNSHKKLKTSAFLCFLFLILISVVDVKLNNKSCFSYLSRWYKYNSNIGVITLMGYIIVKIIGAIYKTDKFYDSTFKNTFNNFIFRTIMSIIMCLFMSRLLLPA